MTTKRITDQEVFEAQEILDATKVDESDHYPPTREQIAEAQRIMRAYAAQEVK